MRFSKKMSMLLLAFLVAFPILFSNHAFSHGDAPSTCENRYDAKIVSMTIDNGMQTYDPAFNPDLEFDALINDGYDVTFTLHTVNVSSMNNTSPGTTWYRHSAYGFGNGVCVADAGPDEDISVTVHVNPPSGIPDGYQQNTVQWGSWPEVIQFTYEVTWYSAEQEQEPQQNDSESVPSELPVEGNDALKEEDERKHEERDEENDKEFEKSNLDGRVLSPFIFKDEKIEVSTIQDYNITEEQSLDIEDALYINGTFASYHPVNETGVQQQLYIVSGSWSMTMNDTSVTGFNASATLLRSDGTDRQIFSLSNLTAVDNSGMKLDSDKISLTSALDYNSSATTSRVNAAITLQRLNVVMVELEDIDLLSSPIYGVVDKVIRIEDGQAHVMVQQFDMI